MNSGYILFCNDAALTKCLTRRAYACTGKETNEIKPIPKGAVLFLYNTDSKNLLGPFTAASEGASRIETGAWNSEIDEHSASANIKLDWEDLRFIENADQRLPFLKDLKECKLSLLRTQTVLDELKNAPLYATRKD